MSSRKLKTIAEYLKDVMMFGLFKVSGHPHIAPTPRMIKLAVTSNCNARCITCNYWKSKPSDELTTDEIRGLIYQAKEMGMQSIQFYGGEPLIRPDLFELIGYAKKAGLRATTITNGFLLDERRAEQLVTSGIDNITISIHGRQDVHDTVMGKQGSYRKAVDGAWLIKKYWAVHRGGEPLQLMINSLLMKTTADVENIMSVIDLCRELGAIFGINVIDPNIPYFGVDGIEKLWISKADLVKVETLFEKLIAISKNEPHLIEDSEAILRYTTEYFKKPYCDQVPCVQGFLGPVFVESSGEIHACNVLKSLGNIRNQPLKEIINSQQWQKVAEDMYNLKCPKCFCGFSKRMMYHLPFYWKELLTRLVHLNFSRYN